MAKIKRLSLDWCAKQVGMTKRGLYAWLKKNQVIDPVSNMPYRRFIDDGLLTFQIGKRPDPRTRREVDHIKPQFTGRGLYWLRDQLDKEKAA